MQPTTEPLWHTLNAAEALDRLHSDPQTGLDPAEAAARLERHGPNRITPAKGRSPLVRFLLQFHNPLIYILLASSLVTAVFKGPRDALIIFGVVLINAVIGYIQEARAEQAIAALAHAMETEAAVLRGGQVTRIPASALVPGDVVTLAAGDKVPADLRLISTRDLQVAEATLTGESAPVEKDAAGVVQAETGLADRRNLAYTATLVTYGQARGVVVATGDATEIGRISRLISGARELATPLTRKIEHFSRMVMFVILGLAALAFGAGLLRGTPAVDSLTAAIALAVAAIPEGLPAALTVTLAIGVSRMARRRAIIRKLPAVETLGSVTIIASDKTGTLTQNQMTVQELLAGGQRYRLSGSGYDPRGALEQDGSPVGALPAAARETLLAGRLCNDSGLVQGQDGLWQAQGDPTEVALLVSARKAGLVEEEVREWPRLDAIPFDSQHQYMATLHAVPGGGRRAYLKGAVEVLLERSAAMLGPDGELIPLDPDAVHAAVSELAGRGLRVLAFALADLPEGTDRIDHPDVSADLIFLGLQAMIDPPRPEAIEAVRRTQAAGIRVKMITGDHAVTAAAIARQFSLFDPALPLDQAPVLTGRELAEVPAAELADVAQRTAVFARVSPEQKLRLVEALQSRGEVVAMTGDGVNDGPALKQADIGVAMGITGTEVAKEAADMVLTDDNFATIAAAVEEGRAVFDNLTKIIAWTLPTNVGQGLVILLAALLGLDLPVTPAQILWINMVTVSVFGLVLALEPREADIMRRAPRQPDAPILTGVLAGRVLLVGLLVSLAAFGMFEWELLRGMSLAEARTAAVNAVVSVVLFYVFNTRSLTQSVFRQGLFSNPWVWAGSALMVVLQALFTYLPAFNRFFGSAPLDGAAWAQILALGLIGFGVVEFEKWLRRRKNGRMLAASSHPEDFVHRDTIAASHHSGENDEHREPQPLA